MAEPQPPIPESVDVPWSSESKRELQYAAAEAEHSQGRLLADYILAARASDLRRESLRSRFGFPQVGGHPVCEGREDGRVEMAPTWPNAAQFSTS